MRFSTKETETKTRSRRYHKVEGDSSEMSRAFGHLLLDNARHSSIFVERCRVKSGERLAGALVSFDVKPLYTNIPQEEGTQSNIEQMHQYYGENLPLPISIIQ